MDQNAYETLTAQIFELFETGEEAISFLNEQGLEKNQYLLEDLQALCTAISSAVEQLAPQIKLKNKLKEMTLCKTQKLHTAALNGRRLSCRRWNDCSRP